MITLALAGKPNCGKSTFFKAATMANVEIANYPFTTINPNFGVAYVKTKCPCHDLHLTCGHCVDGNRFVAVNLIDVARLYLMPTRARDLAISSLTTFGRQMPYSILSMQAEARTARGTRLG